MRHRFLSSAAFAGVTLLALPVAAHADRNPDFDDDATPILRMQPGLLQYVKQNFEVKDTGTAKYPGNDDRRPRPPYIFLAKPHGASGPYNLRLLIQPGPQGHILNVVDMTKVHIESPGGNAPHVTQQAPPAHAAKQPTPSQPAPVSQTSAPAAQAPASNAPEPTADTPSGPIGGPGTSSTQPSLEPPPDPAPATH